MCFLFLKAYDVDSDSAVTYRIKEGNTPDKAFNINGQSGLLTLTRKLSFGETPERQGFIDLSIEGSDNGVPPQLGIAHVIITVRVRTHLKPK